MQNLNNKKILIEIPTWLGDAVMATPAIDNIVQKYPQCELIIFGSYVSTRLFLNHPNVIKIVIDDSKKQGFRYINLYTLAKNIDKVDIALSFRKNFTTKFFLKFINAEQKYIYSRYSIELIHQVIRYNDFINKSLNISTHPNDLKIYINKKKKYKNKPLLGINPGATYGSAKRWYPNEFAKVCIALAKSYDIILFGGPNETSIAKDIEIQLNNNNIKNYTNLAGKTSVEELILNIANLDLFITNDSGPMHVAAAFNIDTISIFGPTKDTETSQWNNKNAIIIKKDYECMPCMKRVCPLEGIEHHKCMKNIKANEVLEKIKELYR